MRLLGFASSPTRTRTTFAAGVVATALLCASLGAQLGAPSSARVPAEAAPSPTALATSDNPLAGRPWGVFKGGMEPAWAPYDNSTGETRRLLAKIALTPKALWFTPRMDEARIERLVRFYIDNAQNGDPETLVQMTIFAIRPWEHNICGLVPTTAERAAYKRWIDLVAKTIGEAHVALIIQPDAPFAMCASDPRVPLRLMKYAVRAFGAKPNTTVYIEAGAADWLKDDVSRALKILIPAGVAEARGFAFNSTHYDSTSRQIQFGAKVAKALADRGILDKHFVINTAENGKPFKGYTYDGPNFNNARLCADADDTRCVTLGIPPTTDVANPAWGLTGADAALAATYVDAYLWIGRPWLINQASPFSMERALSVVRTTPFQ
jgi:hypothetical protein